MYFTYNINFLDEQAAKAAAGDDEAARTVDGDDEAAKTVDGDDVKVDIKQDDREAWGISKPIYYFKKILKLDLSVNDIYIYVNFPLI